MKFFFGFLLCVSVLHAQDRTVMPGNSQDYYRNVISFLSGDSLKGRLPGTEGEKISADYIALELKRSGCTPIKYKRFVHPFDYTTNDTTFIHSYGNIIGKINTRSKQCIVITAHYDHIGYGLHHSNDPSSHAIHNGADDNASGIGLMLAMSEWCKEHRKELKYDVLFIALSGEEDGLFGSVNFLKSRLIDTASIVCNINFDMVGHLDLLRPLLIVEGTELYSLWKTVLPRDTAADFTVMRKTVQFYDGSDHCTFINAKIPAILITTGVTQYYHRPTDDANTINYKGMVAIGIYVQELLLNINKANITQ